MFYAIAIILILPWLLGLMSSATATMGGFDRPSLTTLAESAG